MADKAKGWREYEQHPLGAEFPDIEGEAWDRFVAGVRKHGIVNQRPCVLHEGKIIDGWQLYRACKLTNTEPRFIDMPFSIDPEEFVEIVNDNRRQQSMADQRKRADKRRQRVAALVKEGKTNREIAVKEQVSEKTIRDDVAVLRDRASAEGTHLEEGKKLPPRCGRCARLYGDSGGSVPNCPMCKQEKHAAKIGREPGTSNRARKSKNGKPFYDWRKFDEDMGRFIRRIDDAANTFETKHTPEFQSVNRLADELSTAIKVWRKQLTKPKPKGR